MRRLLIVLSVVILACGEKDADPPKVVPLELPVTAAHLAEDQNLLNVGFGAAVVSRTAELTLESSAIRAIDGDADSAWATPPLDFEQTLVFSLAAPARIERVGIRTPLSPISAAPSVRFESSADGRTFAPLLAPQLERTADAQMFDIAPVEVRYLRVTTTEGGRQFAALQSVHAQGRFLSPPAVASISGCWTVNEAESSFSESDGRVSGVVGGEFPLQVDGGVEGAVYRFAWARGPEWGYALVTLSPDGERLSGMTWHEEAAFHSFGTSWFGDRRPCTAPRTDGDAVVETFLRRAGWYPLFSLRFGENDSLDEAQSEGGLRIIDNVRRRFPSQRLRIVSREYREETPEANRTRAETRLRSLRGALARRGVDLERLEFVALGGESRRRPTPNMAMRLLHGVIELELPGES